ncbi:hypothetical protein SLA2020_479450 [Shorea laevis]
MMRKKKDWNRNGAVCGHWHCPQQGQCIQLCKVLIMNELQFSQLESERNLNSIIFLLTSPMPSRQYVDSLHTTIKLISRRHPSITMDHSKNLHDGNSIIQRISTAYIRS